jgi:outer membrane protein TolC
VGQVVFDGGATRTAVQAARSGRDEAAARGDAAGQDLAVRAARAFVRVLQRDAEVRATDAAVAAAESDRDRAGARRDAGLATDADVLEVDVHLADMRQRQIAAAGDLAVARIELAESLGLALTDTIVPVAPPPPADPPSADVLLQQALALNPRRRQADAALQLADDGRRAARAAMFPTVGLQAAWESNGGTLGAQQSSWLVGAEVRLNVFRGFGDAARLAEARHAHARASAERDLAVRAIEVEVRSALVRLAAARARAAAGQAALTQARESQRIVRDRYASGLATIGDVLRAAAAVLAAESRATQTALDVTLENVLLDRAVGRL